MMGTISSYVKTPLLLPGSPIISQKKNTQVMLMMMFALASNKPMICRCTNSVPAAGGGGEGAELFSVTSSTKSDVDYLGQSTRGDLNLKFGLFSNPLHRIYVFDHILLDLWFPI